MWLGRSRTVWLLKSDDARGVLWRQRVMLADRAEERHFSRRVVGLDTVRDEIVLGAFP
jgi:hypothetical protein